MFVWINETLKGHPTPLLATLLKYITLSIVHYNICDRVETSGICYNWKSNVPGVSIKCAFCTMKQHFKQRKEYPLESGHTYMIYPNNHTGIVDLNYSSIYYITFPNKRKERNYIYCTLILYIFSLLLPLYIFF